MVHALRTHNKNILCGVEQAQAEPMAASHNQRDDSDAERALSIGRIVFYDQPERGTMQPTAGGVQWAVWPAAEIGIILLA